MIVHQGEQVTDDSAKATILNDYFISVLTQESEIIGSLTEVVDAKPQNLLEDFTILQDTFRKNVYRTNSDNYIPVILTSQSVNYWNEFSKFIYLNILLKIKPLVVINTGSKADVLLYHNF